VSPTQANTALAAENLDAERGAKWSLFPAGFTYQPPIESMCPCGTKHTGYFRACPVCQSNESERSNFT